jgi:hypothetical protein
MSLSLRGYTVEGDGHCVFHAHLPRILLNPSPPVSRSFFSETLFRFFYLEFLFWRQGVHLDPL